MLEVQLVLNSIYFNFDGQFYEQNFSTSMGSPLSLIVADLVMRDLEARAEILSFQIMFYFRYIDDIVMAVPKNLVDFTLETFNSIT